MGNYSKSEQVYIRKLIKEDYPIYREVTYSHFCYKNVFTEKFMHGIWDEVNAKNTLDCAIIKKNTNEICGFCQLRNIDTPTPEIGIDIRDGYMGKGYAQEAVKMLIEYTCKNNNYNYNVDYFIWKANRTNYISRHIAEKLGGELISEDPTMDQWIIDYGKEIGILKEEEISYICTYKISNGE